MLPYFFFFLLKKTNNLYLSLYILFHFILILFEIPAKSQVVNCKGPKLRKKIKKEKKNNKKEKEEKITDPL